MSFLSAGWPALRELRIPMSRLEGASKVAFDKADCPRLELLDVSRCNLKNAGMLALTKSPLMATLETLYADGNHSNDFAQFSAPNLRTLRIAQSHDVYVPRDPNQTAADAFALFIAAADVPALRVLELPQWGFGDTGAACFAARADFPSLTRLDLSGNAITDAGAKQLAAAEGLPALADLDLDHNLIAAPGKNALTKAKKQRFPHLARMTFAGNAQMKKSAQKNQAMQEMMARLRGSAK